MKMMESDPSVRVIVLTGSGELFCTGMDLSLSPDEATHELLSIRAAKGVEMFETVRGREGFIYFNFILVYFNLFYFILLQLLFFSFLFFSFLFFSFLFFSFLFYLFSILFIFYSF